MNGYRVVNAVAPAPRCAPLQATELADQAGQNQRLRLSAVQDRLAFAVKRLARPFTCVAVAGNSADAVSLQRRRRVCSCLRRAERWPDLTDTVEDQFAKANR